MEDAPIDAHIRYIRQHAPSPSASSDGLRCTDRMTSSSAASNSLTRFLSCSSELLSMRSSYAASFVRVGGASRSRSRARIRYTK